MTCIKGKRRIQIDLTLVRMVARKSKLSAVKIYRANRCHIVQITGNRHELGEHQESDIKVNKSGKICGSWKGR